MYTSEYDLRTALRDKPIGKSGKGGNSRLRVSDAQSSGGIVPMFPAPTRQVLSERNISLIRRCIDKSEESIKPETLELPARLLDLADREGGRARLVMSAEIPGAEKIKYAALSYCWGCGDTAKSQSITTLSNQEDRKAGFEIKDLSIVIQDAIQARPKFVFGILCPDPHLLTLRSLRSVPELTYATCGSMPCVYCRLERPPIVSTTRKRPQKIGKRRVAVCGKRFGVPISPFAPHLPQAARIRSSKIAKFILGSW